MANIKRQSGFTLLEVTLAVGILAFIVSVGYGALTGILGTKKLLDDRRDTSAVVNAVLGRMVRELQLAAAISQLLPPQDNPENNYPPRTYLVGLSDLADGKTSSDSITYAALEGGQYLPDGGAHNGLVQISYRLAKDPDGDRESNTYMLIREETPLIRPALRAYKRTMVFPVADNVTGLSFAYYDVDETTWSKTWQPTKKRGLPALIRFQISFKSPQGQEVTVGTTVPIRGSGRNVQ